MRYGGTTFNPTLDEERLNEQTIRVYRAMIDEEWHTLAEISGATGDPQASISARLRDLRKPDFGGFEVQRRRRLGHIGLWEYRLQPPAPPAPIPASKKKGNPFLAGMLHAAKTIAGADPAFKNSPAAKALRTEIEKTARR